MLASCAVCVLVQTVYFTHMMQLNSYRNERYRKWCKDHEEKVVNLRGCCPPCCCRSCGCPASIPITPPGLCCF